jgi:hypothetical protein
MSNTLIQIKRSTVTATPANGSLAAGELAYSYASDKLFAGNSSGTGVIEIGGKYFVDVAQQAYDQANTARNTANTTKGYIVLSNSSIVLDGTTGNVWGGSFDSSLRDNYAGIYNPNNNTTLFTFASGGSNVMSVQADGSLFVGEGFITDALGVLPSYGGWVVAASGIKSAYTVYAGTDVEASANVIVGDYIVFSDGTTQNTAYTTAISDQANTARDIAILAFNKANAANVLAFNTGIGANAFTNAVGILVGAGANAYADSVASGSSNYANATFVKLVAPTQTITGNLAITGSLTVSGNAFSIDTETLRVSDPLIYLAGNNYTSDIVDIGFVGNYSNGSANLHTGIFRDATNKEYYVFDSYDKEPNPNHIDTAANGFSLAVLNANIKTSNLILDGIDALIRIGAAFDKANAANVLAYNTGIGANAYTDALVGTVFNKANGAAYLAFGTINVNGSAIVADSNNDTLTITSGNGISISVSTSTDSMNVGLTTTGVTSGSYGGSDSIPSINIDQFGRITSASSISVAIDASAITSGVLGVPRGGTGVGTFTANGILYGDGTNALKVTSAGTEGQVLQASASGVPQFGMLDGGSF